MSRISSQGSVIMISDPFAEMGVRSPKEIGGTLTAYAAPPVERKLHPNLVVRFAPLGYREGQFPVSEELTRRVLALPVYPELQSDDIAYVIHHIGSFFN